MDVKLVVDADCPNVEATRAALAEALRRVGLPVAWVERVQPASAEGTTADPDPGGDPGAARRDPGGRPVARLPSPTILIDGEDVEEGPTGTGCRLYRDAGGRLVGVPPVETLVRALRRASRTP